MEDPACLVDVAIWVTCDNPECGDRWEDEVPIWGRPAYDEAVEAGECEKCGSTATGLLEGYYDR